MEQDRAKELPILEPGQRVWIRTAKTTGTVQEPASSPRSYNVETELGTLRRNRAQLTVLPEPGQPQEDQPDSNVTVTRYGRVSRPPERLDW